jgi:nicotinamide-nucleotide amidase
MEQDDEKQRHQLLKDITRQLTKLHLTIATAESCTGGLLGHTFTNISGSSTFYERGIISYSNTAKHQLLGVSQDNLNTYGAVSEPVAKAMAEGVRIRSNVDIGLSTTGIAGPTGGTKEKPVGLVYIGLATKDTTIVKQFHFRGTRIENKYHTLTQVIILLHEYLNTIQ